MRALLIDDERLARLELTRLLKLHEEVEIVGEAVNVEDALNAIANLQPDLLFLDVRMPGDSGFDLLERLDSVPSVIFTTAYEEYALKAFEENALDYLVKPIAPARLAAAISRVIVAGRKAEPQSRRTDVPPRIFIRDGNRCWFIALTDLIVLKAEGNYTKVFFGPEAPLVLRSLNHLEARLDPQVFFRASRSHIINLRYVKSVAHSLSGGLIVRMSNNMDVEMSRRQAQIFRKEMSL
jgi:two-component system LytT family response regulator